MRMEDGLAAIAPQSWTEIEWAINYKFRIHLNDLPLPSNPESFLCLYSVKYTIDFQSAMNHSMCKLQMSPQVTQELFLSLSFRYIWLKELNGDAGEGASSQVLCDSGTACLNLIHSCPRMIPSSNTARRADWHCNVTRLFIRAKQYLR